ncbi:MAG: alpha/beta hydrolase-fold protein [Saprospiraceae bacterium]
MDLKFRLTSFLVLTFYFLNAQVTIHVTSIPDSTPPNFSIYIAGSFNNWNPGSAPYKLTDLDNGTYFNSFTPPVGQSEYKFTRGSWETVEATEDGHIRPNRVFNYTGGVQLIEVTIAGWEDLAAVHTSADNVEILDEDFLMPQLDRTRRIWIYLPPDYDSTSKRYPVIYMQDGQNLFDNYFSFSGEWKVDESLNTLFDHGDWGAIVVGIDNGGSQRINEYSNWVNSNYGGGDGELYAGFLVHTLKPYIDLQFRTLPGREFTGIAGSSLGGLVSLSTAIDHQDVFSRVGIFSPALWFSDSTFLQVTEKGIHQDMKFYFLGGDNESSTMVPLMLAMHDTLVAEGANAPQVEVVHHADGAHSEWYWSREFPAAYEFLFGDLILDIKDPEVVNCVLYPNPADSFVVVKKEWTDFAYRIYSGTGILIKSGIAKNDSVDVSFLQQGGYFLEVVNPVDKSTSMTMFVKN